jgi:hypothetical protein
MNIICLGCSFTAGMPENNYYSWPEKLSYIRPNDNIYNLSLGGSSILFSLYMLQEIKKKVTADCIIFQITHPYRYTGIKNFNFEDAILTKKQNYIRLDPEVRMKQDVLTITPSTTKFQWTLNREKVKFSQDYYRNYSRELGDIEHDVYRKHIKENSNFCFNYAEIIEEAKSKTIDSGSHFNCEGHDLIANWINGIIDEKIL